MRSGSESNVLGSRNNTLSPYTIHFLVQQNVETPENNTTVISSCWSFEVIFVFLKQNFLQDIDRISSTYPKARKSQHNFKI